MSIEQIKLEEKKKSIYHRLKYGDKGYVETDQDAYTLHLGVERYVKIK
jgi:hypothetical protein